MTKIKRSRCISAVQRSMSIASCLWPSREPQTDAKKGVRLSVYRRILHQIQPCWPHLAGIIGLGLLSIPLNLLLPLPLKIVVDSVLGHRPLPRGLAAIAPAGGPATMLATAAGLLLAVGLLMQAQALVSWLLQTWTGEKMVLDFRSKLFWQSQRLSLTYH